MESSCLNLILHDFRDDIIARKRASIWKEWGNWSVLYKTLSYELSASRGVESYTYVRQKAFETYCPDYKKRYAIADIMNGWWYCFKVVFDINTGRHSDKTLQFLNEMKSTIEGMDDYEVVEYLCDKYKKEKSLYIALLEFLKVIYTIGNITPAKENRNRSRLDNWEDKLRAGKWTIKETKELCFDIYDDNKIINYKETDIKEYMVERIDFILKRAIQIVDCTDDVGIKILKEQITIKK